MRTSLLSVSVVPVTLAFALTITHHARAQTNWLMGGNSIPGGTGTTPTLGTTNDYDVRFITNNSRALLLQHVPAGTGMSINITGGHQSNSIRSTVFAGTIAGGGFSSGIVYSNDVYAHGGTIGGGAQNTVGLSSQTDDEGAFGVVAGGRFNTASGTFSAIGGGYSNSAPSTYSCVPGGGFNQAGGSGSLAAGLFARVRNASESNDEDGDEGTFVWCDGSTSSFISTGPRQFLVKASGGMGLNTNAPEAMLDIRADSTSLRPHLQLVEPANDYARLTMRSEGVTRYWTIAAKNQVGGSAQDRLNFFNSTGGDIMVIRGNRRVGIATIDPGAFTLAVNGECAKPGGGSWAIFCDPKLKKDIEPLRGTLDTLLQLRGYSFEYTPQAIEKNLAMPGRQIGLSADEVERVFPQWVGRDDDGLRYVTERGTTALMVEALRDLRSEKNEQVGRLKAESEQLRSRIEALESALAALSTR